MPKGFSLVLVFGRRRVTLFLWNLLRMGIGEVQIDEDLEGFDKKSNEMLAVSVSSRMSLSDSFKQL